MFVDSFLINILKSPPCTLPLWVPAFCKPCRSMPGRAITYVYVLLGTVKGEGGGSPGFKSWKMSQSA